MRFKELISEEVAPAQVDWDKFNAALAATAIQRNVPRGIDGIVYLGIIGDPSSNTNIEVRFKRDVRIGLDMSPDRSNAYVMQGAAAQFHYHDAEFKGRDIAGANGLQVGTDFDILINWHGFTAEDWPKIGANINLTIAHELMHRGFAIADRTGIKSLMSEETKRYLETRASKIIPGVLDPDDLLKPGAFSPFGKVNAWLASLEHMMIYAMLTGTGKTMPSDTGTPAQPTTWIDDVKKFRKIYLDIEAAARQYVLSYPAPKGSLLALRNELSGETPGYAPTVVADANGKPTLKLIPDEKQTASTKINGSGTTTAWAPKSVATAGWSGDPVKGVVKKPSAPIKLKGWTLSDS
jgi:hypothetical protein